MQRCLVAGLVAGIVMLPGCSAFTADPVFVGALVESVDCPDGRPGCVRVFSEVDGNRTGSGRCILYASTGSEGAGVAVAGAENLTLVPGTVVEWIVPVPRHLRDWNPVCAPTAEG